MLLATPRLLRKSPERRTPSNASRTISNAHLSFLVWSSLFAPIPLFAIAFLQHGAAGYAITFAHIDGKAVFSILFQAYPTTLFGYWIWNVLLKKYPVSTVAPLSLLVPIFGTLGSVAIFGKHVGLPKILATLFIVLGLAIGLYGKYLGLPFAKRARAWCTLRGHRTPPAHPTCTPIDLPRSVR